jgi:hypothetical protein
MLASSVEVAVTVRLAAVSTAATVRRPVVLMLVPVEPPVTVQVTPWSGLLVPFTTAVNCRVPPFATLAVAGLAVPPVTVGGTEVTVTVAVPDLLVSRVEVAWTVKVVALSAAATVRRPVVLMLVPVEPPVTDQVTPWSGLLSPVTVASNCWVPSFSTLAVAGLTETPVTVGATGVTVTVAVPDLLVSKVEVAVTVRLAALSSAATVRRPASLMLVPAEPPVTVQVTV